MEKARGKVLQEKRSPTQVRVCVATSGLVRALNGNERPRKCAFLSSFSMTTLPTANKFTLSIHVFLRYFLSSIDDPLDPSPVS